MLVGLLPLGRALGERAEAQVAVGHERVHAEIRGQGQGLAIARLGSPGVRRIAANGDLAQEPKRPRLVAALAAFTAQGERPPATARASSVRPAIEYASLSRLRKSEWYEVPVDAAC